MRAVIQAAVRQGGGGADTVVVSATTTTPPVVVWAPIRAAEDLRDTPYNPFAGYPAVRGRLGHGGAAARRRRGVRGGRAVGQPAAAPGPGLGSRPDHVRVRGGPGRRGLGTDPDPVLRVRLRLRRLRGGGGVPVPMGDDLRSAGVRGGGAGRDGRLRRPARARNPVRLAEAGADMGLTDSPLPDPIKFVLNWGRRYSLWVFNFGLACCAIEFIATSMSRHDFIRLGVIPFAHGPRQARSEE